MMVFKRLVQMTIKHHFRFRLVMVIVVSWIGWFGVKAIKVFGNNNNRFSISHSPANQIRIHNLPSVYDPLPTCPAIRFRTTSTTNLQPLNSIQVSSPSIPRLLSFSEWKARDSKSSQKRSSSIKKIDSPPTTNHSSNQLSTTTHNKLLQTNPINHSHHHQQHLKPVSNDLQTILHHPHLHSHPHSPAFACHPNQISNPSNQLAITHYDPLQPNASQAQAQAHAHAHAQAQAQAHAQAQAQDHPTFDAPEQVYLPDPHTGTGSPDDPLKILCARTNYASFDCSASIHRSSKHSKSASAILNEKKDKYMLTPCEPIPKRTSSPTLNQEPANFVVFELCDEIEIDNVVLANFEFFSSMFKLIRISVSSSGLEGASGVDWLNVGLFRTRNVRGLQVFAIRNLKGFYRYVRLDFLSHYGSEYYCPLSLVRIYGLTQIDAYRRDQELERRRFEELAQQDEAEAEAEYDHELGDDPLAIPADDQVPVNDTNLPPDGPPARQTDAPSAPSRLTSEQAPETPPQSSHSTPEPIKHSAHPPPLDDGPHTHPSAADPQDHPSPPADASHPSPLPDPSSDHSQPLQQQPHQVSPPPSPHPPPISTRADASGPPSEPPLAAQKEPAEPLQPQDAVNPSAAKGAEPGGPVPAPPVELSTNNGPPPTGPAGSSPPTAAAPPTDPRDPKKPSGSPEAGEMPRASAAPKAPSTDKPSPAGNGAGGQASESIFGQIMKRLSNLETNHELGLKYVEDQARVLEQSVLRVDGRLGAMDEQVRAHQQTDDKRHRHLGRLELQLDLERRLHAHRLARLEDQVAFVHRLALAQFLSTIAILVVLGLTRFQPGPSSRRRSGTVAAGRGDASPRRVPVTRMSPRVKPGASGSGAGGKDGLGGAQPRRPPPSSLRLAHAVQTRSPLKKAASLGNGGVRHKSVEEARLASSSKAEQRLLFGGPGRVGPDRLVVPEAETSRLALPGLGARGHHVRSESVNSQWQTECSNAGSGEESSEGGLGSGGGRRGGGVGGRLEEDGGGSAGGVVVVVVTEEEGLGMGLGSGQEGTGLEWSTGSVGEVRVRGTVEAGSSKTAWFAEDDHVECRSGGGRVGDLVEACCWAGSTSTGGDQKGCGGTDQEYSHEHRPQKEQTETNGIEPAEAEGAGCGIASGGGGAGCEEVEVGGGEEENENIKVCKDRWRREGGGGGGGTVGMEVGSGCDGDGDGDDGLVRIGCLLGSTSTSSDIGGSSGNQGSGASGDGRGESKKRVDGDYQDDCCLTLSPSPSCHSPSPSPCSHSSPSSPALLVLPSSSTCLLPPSSSSQVQLTSSPTHPYLEQKSGGGGAGGDRGEVEEEVEVVVPPPSYRSAMIGAATGGGGGGGSCEGGGTCSDTCSDTCSSSSSSSTTTTCSVATATGHTGST